MIGWLSGKVLEVGLDQLLLNVSGVGYSVFCSAQTLQSSSVGADLSLRIRTHVREDHIHLYGFASNEERQWFDLLLGVQGVGPKMALAILSSLKPADMADALALEDKRPFQAVSGVGPKLAARLVTELKETAPAPALSVGTAPKTAPSAPAAQEAGGTAALLRDLMSALTNLGYDPNAARTAAQSAIVEAGEGADIGALVPLALKALSA